MSTRGLRGALVALATVLAAAVPTGASAGSPPVGQWVRQSIPTAYQGYDLRDVFFTSPSDGWAVGGTSTLGASTATLANGVPVASGSVVSSAGVVLQTSDGGRTWAPVSNTLSTPGARTHAVLSGTLPWELYGVSGAVIGGQPQLLAVGDGGETGFSTDGVHWNWTVTCLPAPDIPCTTDAATSVAAATVGGVVYGLQTRADGGARYSNDGGASWAMADVGSDGALLGVAAQQVSGAVYGWAAGQFGFIFRSTGPPGSWSYVPSGGPDLYGVTFVQGPAGRLDGWAVGGGGTTPGGAILASTDGGQTWTPETVPAGTPALFAVSFENPAVGWAVGAGGTILFTADAGADWTAVPSGTTANLYGVYATTDGNHDYVWAVGAGGTVIALSEPASVTIVPAQGQVQTGGTTAVSGAVYGTVYGEQAGYLLPGSPVTFTTGGPGQGNLVPPSATTAGDGTYGGVTYTAPDVPATVTLTASTPGNGGSVGGSVTVDVVSPPAPPPAPPPSPSGGGGGGNGGGGGVLPGTGGGGSGSGGANGGGSAGGGGGGNQIVVPGCATKTDPLSRQTLAGANVEVLAGPTPAPAGTGTVQVALTAASGLPTGSDGGVAPNVLAYYWNPGLYAWIAVPTVFDGARATAGVPGGSQTALLAYTVVNPLDTIGNWSDPYVLMLESLGVVDGYGDCTFAPDAPPTRNELAKMLAVALRLPMPPSSSVPGILGRYGDAGSIPGWAEPYVAAVTRAGIMGGFPAPGGGFAFEGDQEVTRDEMAAVLGVLLGPNAPQATLNFADDDQIEPWALSGMRRAVAAGLIDGYPGMLLKPLDTTTRGEAAKMLALYLTLPVTGTPAAGG